MYSTKTATVNNTESKYMPVGINEGVKLQNVEVLKSPNGKDYIRFTFADANEKTVNFTEWKNEKNMWIKTDEDLQNRDNQQFGRILQLVNCYYDTTPEFEGNSFPEMINWVKTQLENGVKSNDKTLRLKTIYDKNGFVTVSSYGIYVEPDSIAKENSQIKLFKRDLMERPIVADIEPTTDPLVAAANEAIALNTPVTENKIADFGTPTDTSDPGDLNQLPF